MLNICINDNTYEIENKKSIYDTCNDLGIEIPTVYLEDDITFVEANGNLIDATDVLVEDNMIIYTNSSLVEDFIYDRIIKLHTLLNVDCKSCKVHNCPLKHQFNKYDLVGGVNIYTDCMYYKNGIVSGVLKEKEEHIELDKILNNKHIHKVAIIDRNMKAKKAQILNKGFNEVITNDFIKKFKIVEESALILEKIAKNIDKKDNNLPCVVLEDCKYIKYLPESLKNNVVRVDDYIEITKRIFDLSVDASKVEFIFVTDNEYDNKTNKVVTLEYLLNLPDVESSKIDNITKLLKLDDKEINYNSFINYLIDICHTKQIHLNDIYSNKEFVLKLKEKEIRIINYLLSDSLDGDIILVLSQEPRSMTPSIITDQDINYIYQNYIKEPGKL